MKSQDTKQYALIIGAGPAGLTAAYELLTRTDVVPIVLEKSTYMGGISRTVNYKGNRIDIGGHRFFSKSDRVMNWWLQFMPIADAGRRRAKSPISAPRAASSAAPSRRRRRPRDAGAQSQVADLFPPPLFRISDHAQQRHGAQARPVADVSHRHELYVQRRSGRSSRSRIWKSSSSTASAACSTARSSSPTPKKCGACRATRSAPNGAPSGSRGCRSSSRSSTRSARCSAAGTADLAQKSTETSLIERFLYPKFGPGQMWETVAEEVIARGGRIITGAEVAAAARRRRPRHARRNPRCRDRPDHAAISGDYVFSTMPVKELIASLDAPVPENVKEVAGGLLYRDFITVGLLVDKLLVSRDSAAGQKADRRQLDLHPRARRAGRPVADLQQLEPGDGRRSRQGLDRDGILLLRDRPDLEAIGRRDDPAGDRRVGKDRHHSTRPTSAIRP